MRLSRGSSVCSNCGRGGHFFRECREPITSLGIIAFRRLSSIGTETESEIDSDRQWLLIRRRNSLGMMELMRGKYELRDESGIQALIDQTTLAERESLLTRTFPDLWRELWNGPASRRYHAEYEQARAKFEVLRSAISTGGRRNLTSYCETSTTAWTEPEWGFPKGRRSSSETEVACAIRETGEEAGIKPTEMRILDIREAPLLEEFRGSNGIQYRHRYWIAEVNPAINVRLDPTNSDQCREIGDVRWCSLEEAIELIRPYNVAKLAVLQRATTLVAGI